MTYDVVQEILQVGLIPALIWIWLSLRFFLFPQVVVLEKAGVWQGFWRSWRLTTKHTLRVALTWFVCGLSVFGIYLVVMLVIGLTLLVIAVILYGSRIAGIEASNGPSASSAGLISLGSLLATSVGLVLRVLLYYSLRGDAEGYDEHQLAKELSLAAGRES